MAMKKSKFTEAQVAAALRECASGTAVGQVARRLGVSEQTLYLWKKKYASLDTADIRKVRQLEEENSKLKTLVADLSLDKVMLQDLLSRKW
jgi:putative transposase